MDARISHPVPPATDVYTDVQGLQNLKTEDNQDVALKKIAQQFESMFLHEMLKTMRKANEVFEEDSLFNGGDTSFYRDMYDQQLSLSLAQKGTGLAQTIYQQLSRQYTQQTSDGADKKPASGNPDFRVGRSAETMASPIANAVEPPIKAEPAQEKIPRAPAAAPTAFESTQQFIDTILPHAKAAAAALGVNPLFLAAQAALETGWGKFVVRDGEGGSTHNLFNIKADRSWSGEKAQVATLEYRGGVPVKEQAQFRKYADFAESFADYVKFLQNNPRYQDALAATDADVEFATRLQQAGYATDPGYAEKIMAILRQLNTDPALAAVQ